MQEEFITFKTAKLAKEKNYIWRAERRYGTKSSILYKDAVINDKEDDVFLAAPTQSLLQKWLREVHNIYIQVNVRLYQTQRNKEVMYAYEISTKENDYSGIDDNLNHWIKYLGDYQPLYHTHGTYEEALEIGLQEGLRLINP